MRFCPVRYLGQKIEFLSGPVRSGPVLSGTVGKYDNDTFFDFGTLNCIIIHAFRGVSICVWYSFFHYSYVSNTDTIFEIQKYFIFEKYDDITNKLTITLMKKRAPYPNRYFSESQNNIRIYGIKIKECVIIKNIIYTPKTLFCSNPLKAKIQYQIIGFWP